MTDEGETVARPVRLLLPRARRGARDREPHEPAGLDDRRAAVPARAVTGASVAVRRLRAVGAHHGSDRRVRRDGRAHARGRRRQLTLAAGSEDGLESSPPSFASKARASRSSRGGPESDEDADAMVDAALAAHGALDLVVTAAGTNKVAPRGRAEPRRLGVRHRRQRERHLARLPRGRPADDRGRTRGKFVLVSSTRSDLGHPAGYTAYCASKAAVNLITKALACEWGATGSTSTRSRRPCSGPT